jgi:4-hydroxybutyrate dehydrogenase
MALLFQFPRTHFDFGAIEALNDELVALGIARPLFVTDQGLVGCGVLASVLGVLSPNITRSVFDHVPENPTIDGVERAFMAYRTGDCDGVVAIGGGSVIDTAKALSVLAGHPGPISAYLGHPEKITSKIAPLIAIPTTAGTGSEASRGAGIHANAMSRAVGLNSPYLVPKVAICDPELTLTLPPRLTAGTGMDALSHCIEGFLANPINPPIDAIALDGVSRVFTSLERAVADGNDRRARWNMMMAGLEGGMSIFKGLGPAHAIANACGDRGLHHGMLVTIALPFALRVIEPHVSDKFQRLAAAMQIGTGHRVADAVAELNQRVGLPSTFRALGYRDCDLDDVAADATNSWFNASSPYRPNPSEYSSMIRGVLG